MEPSRLPPIKTQAQELAAYIGDRTVYYVHAEWTNGNTALSEKTIEAPGGIALSVKNDTIVFTAGDKTIEFQILENAAMIPTEKGEEGVIATFAGNGGLQIRYKTM